MSRRFRWPRPIVLGLLAALAAPPIPARGASCPTSVLFEPTDGGTLDAGWSGLAHHVPVFGTSLHLAVSCAAGSPPCGTCTLAGTVDVPEGHRQRCANDTSIECTVATELLDCGSPGTCRYYLSAPQSLVAGGIMLCAMNEVAGSIGGTIGVEDGTFAPIVPWRATLSIGAGYYEGCPRCIGDALPNDTIRDGVCDAGPRAGLACDDHGLSSFSDFGHTSFDCPPSAGVFATLAPAPLAFTTATQSRVLTAASPICNGAPSASCFCSTCNDAAAEACATNADCPPSGGNPGICGGRRCLGGVNDGAPCTSASGCPLASCGRPGEATKPNACLDDTASTSDCLDVGDDDGICTAGPLEGFCTNHPNRGCGSDADCDGVAGACGSAFRPCFPDNGFVGNTVSASGTATPPVGDVADPTAIGAFTCIPPTANPFINVWGLPGLVRMRQSGRLLFDDAISDDLCPASPDVCRTPTAPRNALVRLTDRSDDQKDQIAWSWSKGAATTVAEFGDPLAGDDYALCVYAGPTLRSAMTIPAGDSCHGHPCWQQKPSGFRYRDTDATPNGITQLILKAGDAGRARIQAKGKGLLLPMPRLASIASTVQVQLRNRTSGLCWGATYSPPFETATPEQLKDHAD